MTIGTLLCMPQVGAMEKKATPTDLSDKQAAQLRKAINDYKNNRSRTKAEKIINRYHETYPNDKLVIAKMNEKARFDMGISRVDFKEQQSQQKQKNMQESQLQDQEEQACCVCMEEQNLGPIPCKNKHDDLICQTCLKDIKKSTNLCPLCREPLNN